MQVLQMIPDSWSVGLLNQFLASSVRKSLNQCHTTRIERMLARGENLIVTKEAFQVMKEPLIMTEDRLVSTNLEINETLLEIRFSDSTKILEFINGRNLALD